MLKHVSRHDVALPFSRLKFSNTWVFCGRKFSQSYICHYHPALSVRPRRDIMLSVASPVANAARSPTQVAVA